MAITCFIRYRIDPFQREGIERYRRALATDPRGRANFAAPHAGRFILREERTWLQDVAGTRDRARQVAP